MKFVKYSFKYILTTLAYSSVSLLVVAAIALSLARLALPIVENYKSEIEDWVSENIGHEVEIATLEAVWHGLEPQLVLKGVQILSQDKMSVHGYFQDARLGLNLLASLFEGRVVPGAFTIEGARFGVIRHKDGHISIQGVVTERNAQADSSDFLEQWIFQQRILDIKNSELVWADLKKNKAPRLFHNVNLRLTNEKNRHLIQGSVNLPKQFGSSINIVVDVSGNILSADNWRGRSFVETKDLLINEILEQNKQQQIKILSGELNTRIWGDWDKGQLVSAKGDFGISRLVLSSGKNVNRRKEIDYIKSKFIVKNNNDIWDMLFDELEVNNNGNLWPASRVRLKHSPAAPMLKVSFDYLRLADLVSWASVSDKISDEYSKALRKFSIDGELKNVSLSIAEGNYFMSGAFHNIKNKSYKKIPGFNQLSGQFSISKNAVDISLPEQAVTMSYPEVFVKSSNFQDFKSRILFSKSQGHWNLSVLDASLKFKNSIANGSLSLTGNAGSRSPLLDLAFYIDGGSLSDAGSYLPEKIMKGNAASWIKNALKSGAVRHAAITHHGRVKEYPFRGNEGRFSIDVGVQNAELLFAKQWPKITGIDGLFSLKSTGLHFFGSKGESINNKLENVNVAIPDFRAKDRNLLVSGVIQGDTKDKLAYLHASPLEEMFAKHIVPLEISGNSRLDLSLDIPLVNVRKTTATGGLQLSDNKLTSETWKLNISDVNGALDFTQEAIKASLITGEIFDTPINMNIETTNLNGEQQFLFNGIGNFNNQAISNALEFYIDKKMWARLAKGQTEIESTLVVPVKTNKEDLPPLSLQLRSRLRDLAIDLPAPLGKKVGDPVPFELFTELAGKKRMLEINYGNYQALFEFAETKQEQVLQRGGIGLFEPASLPQEQGFRFSGKLPIFYWSEWQALLFPEDETKSLFKKGGPSSSMFFDLKIDDMEVFGKRFKDVSVHASQTVQYWTFHLSGDALVGNINIPLNISKAQLVANLDKLYITEELDEQSQVARDVDPSTMPSLNVDVKDFRYKDMHLGRVQFVTEEINSGQEIKELLMSSSAVKVTGNGAWVNIGEGQQKSSFSIKVDAKDFGKAVDDWGFKDILIGGKGKIDSSLSWSGKPTDFTLSKTSGSISIDMKDTSILDFDIGAARLFGVLLPRRLLLDFRDVIQKGMYFDTLKGKYNVENGDAFTNSLALKGPVVDIDLAGKVGLGTQTLDKVVTVNRRLVGDSLPLAGTVLMNIDPIVGGSIFVMKKLFEKQIDDILSVQYTVEGEWGAPVITPVDKASPDEDENVDSLSD